LHEGFVRAGEFKTEPSISDEDRSNDRLLEFAFETRAMNDARAVRILLQRSIKARVSMASLALRASISTRLSA